MVNVNKLITYYKFEVYISEFLLSVINFPLKCDDNHKIYKLLMVFVNSMVDDYYIHFNLIFLGSSFIKFDSITQSKMYVME